MRSSPPTKQKIAVKGIISSGKILRLTVMMAAKGTSKSVLNINIAPCRIPLLRGDCWRLPGATERIGICPPDANTALTPSSRKPHLEQYLVTSETCCCPHWGQYIPKTPHVAWVVTCRLICVKL